MISYDKMEKEIVSSIYAAGKDARPPWGSDEQWTRLIKKHLGKLGIAKGYGVCTAGRRSKGRVKFPDGFESEWLYDMVWYRSNDDGLIDVPLVLESEWRGDIRYDFEKLLLARSRYRVMLFLAREDDIEATFDQLTKIVTKCRLSKKGDRYILFGLAKETGEFDNRHLVL